MKPLSRSITNGSDVMPFRDKRPLLGCSGHIHESAYQLGGLWVNKTGRTAWFQPGQMDCRLHAVSLEVSDDLSIQSVRQSVFVESKV